MKILKESELTKYINNNLSKSFFLVEKFFNEEETSKIKKLLLEKGNKSEAFFYKGTPNEIEDNLDISNTNTYTYVYNEKDKEDFEEIYEDLFYAINFINKKYKFDILGINEKLVLNETLKGAEVKFHTDLGAEYFSTIKLVCLVGLSRKEDYEGGELQFFSDTKNSDYFDVSTYTLDLKLDLGDVVIFPAFELHGVKKVLSGKRYTMVSSGDGKPFQ